jgi:hypothetical protein
MEATCSSETLVDFQWTTRRYSPGDKTLEYGAGLYIYMALSDDDET